MSHPDRREFGCPPEVIVDGGMMASTADRTVALRLTRIAFRRWFPSGILHHVVTSVMPIGACLERSIENLAQPSCPPVCRADHRDAERSQIRRLTRVRVQPGSPSSWQPPSQHPHVIVIACNDLYAFDPNAKVSMDPFVDIIGRHFKQPNEDLGRQQFGRPLLANHGPPRFPA